MSGTVSGKAPVVSSSSSSSSSSSLAKPPNPATRYPTVHLAQIEIPKVVQDSEPKTTLDLDDKRLSSTVDSIETETAVTAVDRRFNCGDDVFVLHKDGCYYLGTVISASATEASGGGGPRWLVKFGDNTERWAGPNELRLLASPSGGADATPMCVVCKVSSDERPHDEVIVCDKCSRGYHPVCHSPPVNSQIKGASWHCRRCVNQRFKVSTAANDRTFKKIEMVKIKQSLTYDISTLHWDAPHRVNTEGLYCYCGTAGDWFAQMLQCTRCKQWFHQNCLSCLRYPLYTGDRFYMFVCSICNYGNEFLRRLQLKWVDLVHLVLYNLTVHHAKKYFDFDTIIIPYIADNWHALQLPQKMHALTAREKREIILTVLCSNGTRFKCGREIKKKTTIWGLRSRTPPAPPAAPTTPLPRGVISDVTLSGRWSRLPFVPCPDDSRNVGEYRQMLVPADGHWRALMTGKRFVCASASDGDSSRSTPSPMPASDIPSAYRISNESKKDGLFREETVESDYVSSEDMPLCDGTSKSKKLKLYEINFQGGGLVKKSVPFPKLGSRRKNDASSKHKDRKRIKQAGLDDEEQRMHRNRKKLRKSLAKQQKLDALKSMLSENASINSGHESKPKESGDVILPPTPPTSMSAPPTPPAVTVPSSSSNSSDVLCEYQTRQSYQKDIINYDSDPDSVDFKEKSTFSLSESVEKGKFVKNMEIAEVNTDKIEMKCSFKSVAINLEIPKLSTKNIIEHSKIMSLHHIKTDDVYSIFSKNKIENDSSDDTSSRGTLDSIIPHPANFQGANNPFRSVGSKVEKKASNKNKILKRHSLNKGNAVEQSSKNSRISLPVQLNPVIPNVKLTKRQLSEKDLIIGPNGEVKRRRHRRVKALSTTQPCAAPNERQKSLRSSFGQDDHSKNVQNNPPGDKSAKTRCLRQRQEKNYSDRRRGSTSSNSPATAATANQDPQESLRSLNLASSADHHGQWNGGGGGGSSRESIRDLKSSVHSYFGAAVRISAGEKFALAGKRITEAGKLQYLIEWEGHHGS